MALSQLKFLADLCPSTYGLSVYVARSWYMAYRPEAYWDAKVPCVAGRPVETPAVLRPLLSSIRVMPNPAQDHLRLWVETPDEAEGRFELHDLSGRLWAETRIAPNGQSATLDVSALPTGFYLYVFRQNGRTPKTGKVIIVR